MATAEPVVMVEWMDSVSLPDGPWHEREEVESLKVSNCTTVGVLVREDDDALTLAGSWNKDQYGGIMVIPKVSIVDRKEMK